MFIIGIPVCGKTVFILKQAPCSYALLFISPQAMQKYHYIFSQNSIFCCLWDLWYISYFYGVLQYLHTTMWIRHFYFCTLVFYHWYLWIQTHFTWISASRQRTSFISDCWLCARLQCLQCVSNVDTAVVHQAIDLILQVMWGFEWCCIDS